MNETRPDGTSGNPSRAAGPPARRRGPATASFPVVGVGASAGGLDAFRQLLAHVPANAGLALVLVQHLEPKRASMLSDALGRATRMKVAQAEEGVRLIGKRFENSISTMVELIDAQSALNRARANLIEGESNYALANGNVYHAAGTFLKEVLK